MLTLIPGGAIQSRAMFRRVAAQDCRRATGAILADSTEFIIL